MGGNRITDKQYVNIKQAILTARGYRKGLYRDAEGPKCLIGQYCDIIGIPAPNEYEGLRNLKDEYKLDRQLRNPLLAELQDLWDDGSPYDYDDGARVAPVSPEAARTLALHILEATPRRK